MPRTYWEIGGAGGPAGAIGGGGGTEAVTAGGASCTGGAGGSGTGSGMPLETAADTAGAAGGAGVTGGTGSARSAGLSPLRVSCGASVLTSDVPSPGGLVPSTLAVRCPTPRLRRLALWCLLPAGVGLCSISLAASVLAAFPSLGFGRFFTAGLALAQPRPRTVSQARQLGGTARPSGLRLQKLRRHRA
jgi:hypothetical protein